jgi:hypothetical protein
MPAIPTVTITVQDNGSSASLSVPQSTVQLKVGCAISCPTATTGPGPGQINEPYATSNPTALQSQYVGGPLVEAGGMVCQAGNVVVAVACPIVTKGAVLNSLATAIANSGNTGNAAIGITLDTVNGAWDTYYVKVKCTTAGTLGTAPGPSVAVSLDAGRNYGTPIPLGSALALVLGSAYTPTPQVGGTGIQLTFTTAQTMSVGDTWTFATVAPQSNGAGVAAAIAAFQGSQYGVAGVGSMHNVGDVMHGGSSVSDIATIYNQVQAGAAIYEYNRIILDLRDTLNAGGLPYAGTASETEATWINAVALATSGTTAVRVCADDGYYNMPSPYANAAAGQPAYRRPLSWAQAVRRTQIPLQRRAGRVKDGPLANIVVNPAVDPGDGFVYHDERVTPGLNAARIATAMTWPKKGAGFYMCQEPLLSAPGSQFTELAIGNVLDAACDIAYAAGVEEVSDDLLTQSNGTLDPIALNVLQGNIQNPLNAGLVSMGLVSGVTSTVDPTADVEATGVIPVKITVNPRAYVNSMSETVSLSNGGA